MNHGRKIPKQCKSFSIQHALSYISHIKKKKKITVLNYVQQTSWWGIMHEIHALWRPMKRNFTSFYEAEPKWLKWLYPIILTLFSKLSLMVPSSMLKQNDELIQFLPCGAEQKQDSTQPILPIFHSQGTLHLPIFSPPWLFYIVILRNVHRS